MKNKKGFTLVEVISVVALLGLLIGLAVPNVIKASEKAKQRTLKTKIENIEKAAVLYAQKHRENFTKSNVSTCLDTYCKNSSGSIIDNCYCYSLNYEYTDSTTGVTTITNKTTIPVSKLINPSQALEITEDSKPYKEIGTDADEKGYINPDDEATGKIKNSTDESKSLNECEIQIYQKYGKIYAVYTKIGGSDDETKCWID